MILYVLRYYPTLTETFVYREIQGLQDRGMDVRIVAIGKRADGAMQDEVPDVPVYRPSSGWGRMGVAWGIVWALSRSGGPSTVHWLYQTIGLKGCLRVCQMGCQLRKALPDRIHAHFAGESSEWALGLSRLLNVPFSVTTHAVDIFKPRKSLQTILQYAKPVIAISDFLGMYVLENYGVRAQVVRCGVDTGRFSKLKDSDSPPQQRPLRVISIGRHVEKKGLEQVVEAVEHVSFPIHLHLVSNAPKSWESERVRVEELSPSKVPEALSNADVFVLPCRVGSDGDMEGIPVAMMEAMSMELPVITTEISGIPELVDASVGWFVEPGNVADIVKALCEAYGDPINRIERGKKGRTRILEGGFTLPSQVDGVLRAWEMDGMNTFEGDRLTS